MVLLKTSLVLVTFLQVGRHASTSFDCDSTSSITFLLQSSYECNKRISQELLQYCYSCHASSTDPIRIVSFDHTLWKNQWLLFALFWHFLTLHECLRLLLPCGFAGRSSCWFWTTLTFILMSSRLGTSSVLVKRTFKLISEYIFVGKPAVRNFIDSDSSFSYGFEVNRLMSFESRLYFTSINYSACYFGLLL